MNQVKETPSRRGSWLFTVVVVSTSLGLIATLPFTGLSDHFGAVALLVVLAAISGSRAVHVPGLSIQITVSDLFVFCALMTVAPIAVPLVALAGVSGAVFGPARRPLSLKTVFNLAAVPLSAAVATWTFLMVGSGRSMQLAEIAGLLAAATSYVLANLLLVATVIVIDKGHGFAATLLKAGPCAFVSTVTSLLIGAGLMSVFNVVGLPGLLLGTVATAPILAYAREQRDRAAS